MINRRRGTDQVPVSDIVYELPLNVWHDVGGSKIRPLDLLVVAADLCRIQFHYFMK